MSQSTGPNQDMPSELKNVSKENYLFLFYTLVKMYEIFRGYLVNVLGNGIKVLDTKVLVKVARYVAIVDYDVLNNIVLERNVTCEDEAKLKMMMDILSGEENAELFKGKEALFKNIFCMGINELFKLLTENIQAPRMNYHLFSLVHIAFNETMEEMKKLTDKDILNNIANKVIFATIPYIMKYLKTVQVYDVLQKLINAGDLDSINEFFEIIKDVFKRGLGYSPKFQINTSKLNETSESLELKIDLSCPYAVRVHVDKQFGGICTFALMVGAVLRIFGFKPVNIESWFSRYGSRSELKFISDRIKT